MKRTFICLVILFFLVVPSAARQVELTLYPAKAPKLRNKYQLLPRAKEQSGADALPLYEKAVQSLPKDSQRDQKIRQWVKTPLDKLPRKQVQSTLQQLRATLQLVEQAARCKQCNWPPFKPGTLPKNLSEYRKLAFVLAVQARLQIAQGKYDQSVRTIQTGLAMARHMGEAPNLNQGLVGVAIAALMCRQLETYVQCSNAPNLYQALQALPKPLVDITKTMELEIANLKNYNFLLRRQFEKQLKPAHERVRMIMNRLDRNVAALQCVEALRLYAAAHDGKFPNALTEITRIPIPNDPVTKKPFVYSRTGSKAVLEAPAPKGATAKDAMRYDLTLLADTPGQSKYTPDAVEILRRYRQSLSWQESVSMKVVIESGAEIDGQMVPSISERTFTFRREHERAEWLGKKLEKDDNNVVDLEKCQVIKTIMDGNAFARLTSGLDSPPIGAFINRDKEFYRTFLNRLLCHPINGGPLWGRMFGSNYKNVADLLIESGNVHLHKNRENINGSVCYVFEAVTRYGKVTAWIAPEKGYNALKWSIQKEPGDLFNDGPVTVSSWLAEFVADDLQKVGDFWVTKVGCLTFNIGYGDEYPIKTKTTKHKYQVSDIQIDPDFEALEAFKIDFPDGTPVQIAEAPGIRYVWQDGKPVRRK